MYNNGNSLTQRFQNRVNTPINYMNNQMLNNNPIYSSNIYDNNFYQQMMLQKEEQMRKVKNINDLGLSKEQITEYVIAPIKVEKSDASELERLRSSEEQTLTEEFIKTNWWNQRTNAPYKNIFKNHDWQREFKNQDDLIIHKWTDLDKVGLIDEYNALLKVLEKHNGELKLVFSSSKETEHKKAFKFVEKYRKRVKYNPKDYNELKDFYNKEQKKFDKTQRRFDNIISRVMDEDIDEKELKLIEAEFLQPSKSKSNTKSKSKSKSKSESIDKQLQSLIDELDEDEIKELEEEVRKELEEQSPNPSRKIRKELDDDKSSNSSRKIRKELDDDNSSNSLRRVRKDTYDDNSSRTKNDNTSDNETRRIRIERQKIVKPDEQSKPESEKRIKIKRSENQDQEKSVDIKNTPQSSDNDVKRIRIVRSTNK